MSNRRKRYRVRYDRIAGVAAVFIVLIILLVSCCKSCGGNSKDESSIVPTSSKEEKDSSSQKSNSDVSATDGADDSSEGTPTDYATISAMPNEIYTGDLIVVNKEHEYSVPASTEEAGIKPIYELASDSYQYRDYEISLASKTITALNSMMDAYYSAVGNTDIMVISGYRTKEEQDEMTDTDIKGGYSEYHTGLNFDLSVFPNSGESPYYYTPDGDYAWVNENCANYGFILRYPDKKEDKTGVPASTYKFRYVGVPHALYMKENDLCLEEYISELKNYTSDGDHLKVSGGEKKYEIYYVPADPSANTDIPVPDGKTYTISGNNIDGFIVTVEA